MGGNYITREFGRNLYMVIKLSYYNSFIRIRLKLDWNRFDNTSFILFYNSIFITNA